MCKHGNVLSLLLLTDERLTIGILHSIGAGTMVYPNADYIYQSNMGHEWLPPS